MAKAPTKKTQTAPKPPSTKRVAAAEAYTKAMGKAPPARMSIKAMNETLATRAVGDRRQAQRRAQVDALWGSGKGVDPVTGTKSPGTGMAGVDPLKIIEKRNETARSHAEVAKSTGNRSRAKIGQELIARNDRDIARMSATAPRATPAARPPLLSEAHAKSIDRMSAPMPPGSTWRDRAYGTTPQPAPAPRMGIGQAYNTFNRVAAPIATGVAAAQAFRAAKEQGKSTLAATGDAAISAAPGAALMAAQPLGRALSSTGSAGLEIGRDLIRSAGLTDFMLGFPMAKVGVVSGVAGAALKATGEALKVAGRVAAPLMAGYGAYQGAKNDSNAVRGAVRGAIGALDPTAIVSNLGATTGLMSDPRGIGERVFDAAFGKAGPKGQAQAFEDANAKFRHDSGPAGAGGGPRGWANPANQAAAQRARGVQNVTDWAQGAAPKGAR